MGKKDVLRDKTGKKVGEVTDVFSLIEGSRREMRDRSGKLTGTYKNEPTLTGGERTVYRNAKGTKRGASATRYPKRSGGGGGGGGGHSAGGEGALAVVVLGVGLGMVAIGFACAAVGWVAWRPLFASSREPGQASTFMELFWPLAVGGGGAIAVVAGLCLLVRGASGPSLRLAAGLLVVAGCLAYLQGGPRALEAVDSADSEVRASGSADSGETFTPRTPTTSQPGGAVPADPGATTTAPATTAPAATTAPPSPAPTAETLPPATTALPPPVTLFPLPTEPPPTTAPPLPAEASLKDLPSTSGEGYWASGVVNGRQLDPALLMDRPQCGADPAFHQVWELGGEYQTLTATIGIGDLSLSQLNAVYAVYADGEKLAGGEALYGQPQTFTADISGHSTLTIDISTTFCPQQPGQNIGYVVLGGATVTR